MKGDKGKLWPALNIYILLTQLAEFSGTLLGFDDYVSEYPFAPDTH
jgi:hypothetical protein